MDRWTQSLQLLQPHTHKNRLPYVSWRNISAPVGYPRFPVSSHRYPLRAFYCPKIIFTEAFILFIQNFLKALFLSEAIRTQLSFYWMLLSWPPASSGFNGSTSVFTRLALFFLHISCLQFSLVVLYFKMADRLHYPSVVGYHSYHSISHYSQLSMGNVYLHAT